MTLPMSEADLQRAIIDAAKLYGWRVAHFRPARTEKGWRTPVEGDAGFPDLVLAKQGRLTLFLELKSEKGRITEDQQAWWRALWDNYLLVRPKQLNDILRMLAG